MNCFFNSHHVNILMILINLLKKFDLSQFLNCPQALNQIIHSVKLQLQKYVKNYMYC